MSEWQDPRKVVGEQQIRRLAEGQREARRLNAVFVLLMCAGVAAVIAFWFRSRRGTP
jgi:hypothetical protein